MQNLLTIEQQNEIARMQAAIVNIDRLSRAINKSAKEYGIKCRELQFPVLGLLAHELNGIMFEASCLIHEGDDKRRAA